VWRGVARLDFDGGAGVVVMPGPDRQRARRQRRQREAAIGCRDGAAAEDRERRVAAWHRGDEGCGDLGPVGGLHHAMQRARGAGDQPDRCTRHAIEPGGSGAAIGQLHQQPVGIGRHLAEQERAAAIRGGLRQQPAAVHGADDGPDRWGTVRPLHPAAHPDRHRGRWRRLRLQAEGGPGQPRNGAEPAHPAMLLRAAPAGCGEAHCSGSR
jgi:hypothetical protein